MSNLDDKLREILTELQQDTAMRSGWDDPNEVTDLQEADIDRAIPQIKKCFADEGYVYIPTITKGVYSATGKSLVMIGLDEVMTGQEWLTRFEAELWKPPKQELPTSSINDDGESHDRFYRTGGLNFMYLGALEAAKRASGLSDD